MTSGRAVSHRPSTEIFDCGVISKEKLIIAMQLVCEPAKPLNGYLFAGSPATVDTDEGGDRRECATRTARTQQPASVKFVARPVIWWDRM
jgi:hypothetical protein